MTSTNKNTTNGKSTSWKKNLIIGVIGISVGVLIAVIFAINQAKPDKQPTPPPTKEPLTLTKVSPQPPIFQSIWSTEKITLTFNKPIDPKTIYHQVAPPEDLKLIFNQSSPNSFSFVPLTGWEENVQYTLSVSKRLSSTSGEQLEKDLEIKFTRHAPENLPEPIENY